MRQVLKRILDQILETPPPPLPPQPVAPSSSLPAVSGDVPAIQTTEIGEGTGWPATVPADIDFSAVMGQFDDEEFVDWLNNVDWTRCPWVEPGSMLPGLG